MNVLTFSKIKPRLKRIIEAKSGNKQYEAGNREKFTFMSVCCKIYFYFIYILAASPLASSGFAAIGDWSPKQTSIF